MSELRSRPGCLGILLRIAVRLLVLAAIIGAVAAIVPGIHVYGGFGWYVWVAFIFSVVNMILGPIFRLLSLPFIVLTLGLFLLIVNAALLAITAWLSSHLAVDSFGAAVFGGFLIALFSWIAELLLPPRLRRDPA
jgi:putative membrane protein